MLTELIGWAAAAILVATIGRQVYTQWRAGTTDGVSKWLFIGQVSASTGFVVYSWLLRDWVFVATNAVMLAPEDARRALGIQQFGHDGTITSAADKPDPDRVSERRRPIAEACP